MLTAAAAATANRYPSSAWLRLIKRRRKCYARPALIMGSSTVSRRGFAGIQGTVLLTVPMLLLQTHVVALFSPPSLLAVADHDVPDELIAATFAAQHAFFSLPLEQKMSIVSSKYYRHGRVGSVGNHGAMPGARISQPACHQSASQPSRFSAPAVQPKAGATPPLRRRLWTRSIPSGGTRMRVGGWSGVGVCCGVGV